MIYRQMESAQSVQRAANCLTRVCYERSLRDCYNDTVREGVPQWAADLLDKLK